MIDTIDPAVVAANLEEVRARIAGAGGDPARVRVVAATKDFGVDAVRAALAVGLEEVGESKAQSLLAKVRDAADLDVRWHFLGRLQRNKVRAVAPIVWLWQSVDRLPLAEEIAERAPGAAVLVQVNVSGEPQKGGCPPAETGALVDAAGRLGLDVRGLMAIGPLGPPEAAREGFRLLARLGRDLSLEELSMGMTEDLEVAVQEGATMVRVGRALFGTRR